MTTPIYQALIVDDEPISRKMMSFALTQEGIACEMADDGNEAERLFRHHSYDLVVTDLIMPNRNGHSLTVDLLAQKTPPVVIVHTSVDDPRITKDLLSRGVDDVVYKPTNYKTLAARAVVLIRRRREKVESAAERKPDAPSRTAATVSIEEIEERLKGLPQILPVSQAAFDVYNMTSSDEIPLSEIAAGIARDPSLSADVLRLANSAFCHNPSGKKIVDLEEAVLRVGQKRIGELALATSALSAVTGNMLPWINLDLAWRRSIAAGVAVDLLLSRGNHAAGHGGGLFLSAIMHMLGRLGLGMLYPQQYRQMIDQCKQSHETLDEIESRVFPLNTGQVLGSLLKAWNIPEDICEPLNYTSNSFLELAPLDEPLRTKTELLKLAIFLGQIAVGKWEPWDKVEFPSSSVLKRLRIESLSKIIEDTRADTEHIINHQKQSATAEGKHASSKTAAAVAPAVKILDYCNLSSEAFDFFREIMTSMGITLDERTPQEIDPYHNLLLNCLWNPPQRIAECFPPGKRCGEKLLVTDPNHVVFYRQRGKVVSLPASYGALHAACSAMTRIDDNPPSDD